jgi:hypothetical protein
MELLISKDLGCMVKFHADHAALSPPLRFFEGNTIKKLTSGQWALLFSALGNSLPNTVECEAQVTFLGCVHALVRVMKGEFILLFFCALKLTPI